MMKSVRSNKLPVVADMPLYPAQQRALQALESMCARFDVCALIGARGYGVSRTVAEFAGRQGATVLDAGDYLSLLHQTAEDRWDERVINLIDEALARSTILVLDDFPFLTLLVSSRSEREGLILQSMAIWRRRASEQDKTLVFAGGCNVGWNDDFSRLFSGGDEYYQLQPGQIATLGRDVLDVEDYAAILINHAGSVNCSDLDFDLLYQRFPGLSPRELGLIGGLAALNNVSDTAGLTALISDKITKSNVVLSEVEHLGFEDLPGSEHIAEALETHVVLPFERPDVARRLGIKAHRGVMLFGPPGTGKTTIGRALAHRMKSKFFVIDGSVATEPAHAFMGQVHSIIEQAKKNAPSVLFIDDADTLFTIPHAIGMMRALLSLLDGVESGPAGNVCVMMTVMDARKVPDAIMRSGRVELWLETKFPNAEIRARILRRWIEARAPGAFPPGEVDYDRLVAACERFNPADLRRIVSDSALLYAADLAGGCDAKSANSYLETAIQDLVEVRQRMSAVLHDPSLLAGVKIEEFA